MSVSDPIADMLVRIRNAQAVHKEFVSIPLSKVKLAIAKILKSEGYIKDFHQSGEKSDAFLTIDLKYYVGEPVISELKRVSKPGLRVYKKRYGLPKVLSGLGISIVSTSKGLMTDREARDHGLGGEIICYVA